MQFVRLDLLAYGPFTDVSIDFSHGGGLHVIYGPNEAGKSSALRALRSFLFGIHPRSDDNFVHPYPMMRVGGILKDASGQQLHCIRRKGNRNTLRAPDDETIIEEHALQKMLGGVDEETFCSRHGIGHAQLIAGGEALAEGGGDLGHSLFAAASGVAHLGKIRRSLEEQAEQLFLPTGRVRQINQALQSLHERQSAVRKLRLPTSQWLTHDKSLREAKKQKERIQEVIRKKETRQSLLRRIEQAIPLIPQRHTLIEDLRKLDDAPLLSEDFAEHRRTALTQLDVAQSKQRDAAEELEKIGQQLAEFPVPTSVLDNAHGITQLHQRLGSYQKANDDRAALVTHRDALLSAAEQILKELGQADLSLEEAGSLRVAPDERVRISNLGNQRAALLQRVQAAAGDLRDTRRLAQQVQQQLEQFPPVRSSEPLCRALQQAVSQGPLETQRVDLLGKLEVLRERCEREILALRPWSGSLEELPKLPLPSRESIEQFEEDMSRNDQELSSLKREIGARVTEVGDVEQQLESMLHEQDVPTEDDLTESRRRRDVGWRLLQDAWEKGETENEDVAAFIANFESATDLPEAFETAMAQVDLLADRLRREAESVAQKAQLLARRHNLTRQVERLREDQNAARQQLESVQIQWRKQWEASGIEPASPREMQGWLDRAGRLCDAVQQVREMERDLNRLQESVNQHGCQLSQALESIARPAQLKDETLRDLIARCQTALDEVEKAEREYESLIRQRTELLQQISALESSSHEANEALKTWSSQWAEATAALRLREGAEPDEANAVLESIKQLFDNLKDAEGLQDRICGIDADTQTFTADVRRLCEATGADSSEASVDQVVAGLSDRLASAQGAEKACAQLEEQRCRKAEKYEKAKRDIESTSALLATMCKEAGCDKPDELPEAERRSSRRHQCERELREIEQRLVESSAGQPLDQFIDEATRQNAAVVQQQLSQLESELAELDEQRSQLDVNIGEEQNELRKMDGSARAAEAQEDVEKLLAQIRSDAQQFARLRLASVVLKNSIERYRDRHQGPVIQRASQLFAALTLGSFDRLIVEHNGQGQPVLVGVRHDGNAVGLDGMSDGTRDPLYLALRLSSLETNLAIHKLPFIVDDVMVNFDDERTVAGLSALAQLSRHVQVILFTHHIHLVQLAEENLDEDVLCIHTLDHRGAASAPLPR